MSFYLSAARHFCIGASLPFTEAATGPIAELRGRRHCEPNTTGEDLKDVR